MKYKVFANNKNLMCFGFPIDIYGGLKVVFAGGSTKEFAKLSNENPYLHDFDGDLGDDSAFCITKQPITIFLPSETDAFRVKECTGEPSILSHEALHATFAVLNHVHMKYSEESEEAYTYLLAFIISTIYNGIRTLRDERNQKALKSKKK